MARILREGLEKKGYKLFLDSPTNQQFIVISNNKLKEISGKIGYSTWEKYDEENTVIRLATDWATSKDDIETLLEYL